MQDLGQHKRHIRNVMDTIYKAGMKLKPSKCEFHKEETEYLRFIINSEGVKADPVKSKEYSNRRPHERQEIYTASQDSVTFTRDS